MTFRDLIDRLLKRKPRPPAPTPTPTPGPTPTPTPPPPSGTLKGLVARGDSVAFGSGLGNPMTVDMGESWLRELGEFFNVPVSNAGVPGSLTRDAIAAQNRDSTREAAGWKLIVWTGHNDINKGFPSEVIPGIRTLTNKANGNYLVMGLTTGLTGEKGSDYYNTVCAPGGINSQLAAEHGPRFFNSHRFLVDKAMASLNMTPTAQDKLDIANDIPPDSLRADAGRGHLNERGQQAIANALHTLLK